MHAFPLLRRGLTALFLLASPVLIPTESLIRDTVILDRAYIPALILTGRSAKDKKADAKIRLSVAKFSDTWRDYRAKYAGLNPSDPYWIKDFDHMDLAVSDALKTASAGHFAKAHVNLEEVRLTFHLLRKRNRLDYYLDSLTDYHSGMEGVALLLENKKPADLTDADLDNIRSVLAETLRSWTPVTNYSKRVEPFQLGETALRRLDNSVAEGSSILDSLRDALEQGDRQAVLAVSKRLKPNYIGILSLFGNSGQ